ncbi:MAG: cyclic nucleotide-binding domain-containing protein [Desulfobulbales bacterium]|nr:cyclic nucleotide-binding domain-containing protein [Desulfobulbales bacterium]
MEQKKCIECDPQAEEINKAFSFLDSEEVEELCPFLELREWQANNIVMQEGDIEDYMGFVIKGKLAVKKETDYWGKQIVIAILDKGSMVGEGALIDQAPRSNTILAMENSKLLVLTARKMEDLILNKPMLAIKLMKYMLHIISLRLRKAGDRISELL